MLVQARAGLCLSLELNCFLSARFKRTSFEEPSVRWTELIRLGLLGGRHVAIHNGYYTTGWPSSLRHSPVSNPCEKVLQARDGCRRLAMDCLKV